MNDILLALVMAGGRLAPIVLSSMGRWRITEKINQNNKFAINTDGVAPAVAGKRVSRRHGVVGPG